MKLKFLFFSLISLSTFIAIYFYKPSTTVIPQTVEAQTPNTDWPQLQHDPQRTGYSNQSIRNSGSFQIKWTWHPPDRYTEISDMAQPVISSGTVIINDATGIVYALDENTGTEKWHFATGAPIYASAAIYNNTVYVGSQNGKIYALKLSDGTSSWNNPYQTNGGIVSSPLIFNNTLIITSKDGSVYSLNPSTGAKNWSTNLQAPILTSPSASTSKNYIFVGAENLKAYALNASTGAIVWQKQLIGDSFRYSWPVVADAQSIVFFRTEPGKPFHTMLGNPSQILENGRCINFNFGECNPNNTNTNCSSLNCDGKSIQSTPADYQSEQTRIINYLQQNTNEQTFFALDIQTGAEKYIAPILYTGGGGKWPGAPVIDTTLNKAYVIYRSYYSMFDSATTVRPYVDIAQMNISTGTITPFDCGKIGGESCKMAWEDFHLVGDEETYISAATNAVLVGSYTSLGGIYLNTSPEKSFFVVSQGNYRTPTLQNTQWSGNYASSYGNPISAVTNGKLFYRAGLLGMMQ